MRYPVAVSVILEVVIVDISITEKSFGPKQLYKDVSFSIADSEKIGLIGRNGTGKSTLLGILAGHDHDYTGDLVWRRGVSVVSSRQEHHGHTKQTVLEYILSDLPEYAELAHIIETYPAHMSDDVKKISQYTEALQRFSDLGYYDNEGLIVEDLKRVQITEAMAHDRLGALSGGQKRLVEVVKITHAHAHLALLDEPTNHMDYVAKAKFIDWMKSAGSAMLIVSHDRDVLQQVDKIVEIKDQHAVVYDGNYDTYLSLNATRTTSGMHEYEVVQRQIANLNKRIAYARSMKSKWTGTADKRNPFVVMENKAKKEREVLESVEKPSFWIDKQSVEGLGLDAGERYQKYKAKNIRIYGTKTVDGHTRQLVEVRDLSLGYDEPLFAGVGFELREGERVELRGRNGTGKTTLIRTLLQAADYGVATARCFAGYIEVDSKVSVGVYEQEVSSDLFTLTLGEAIERIYHERRLAFSETMLRQLLADYLFEPSEGGIKVSQLSGGQKARLQLIAMLVGKPNLLVLDEPTNHLDLPSIEELENALVQYKGAILYVSHDSYFQAAVGGRAVSL